MATTTAGAKTVPLDSIVWREPSRPIDPRHVKDLAASIGEVGQLHRIGVVDLGEGKYEGRFGRHRFEAVKSLGGKEIKVEVLDLDGVDKELATIHENTKHLDMNPIQRARTFQRFAELRKAQDPKLTQEAIAKELQVSQPEFSNTVMLLDQEVHVQKLVEDGQLSPGHIEAAVAPLAKELPEEDVVKFAHDLVRMHTDVRTAKEEASYLLERHRTELAMEAAVAAAKKAGAKVLYCPDCNWTKVPPQKSYEAEGRLVLEHKEYGKPHRWYGDTGEPYLTPAERKEAEKDQAAQAKARKAAAKTHVKKEKVVRDFAVFFSRASVDAWAAALLKAEVLAGIKSMSFERTSRTGDGYSYDDYSRAGTFVIEAAKTKLPAMELMPLSIPDGKGGKFLARIQIGKYRSTPSAQDSVVESRDVSVVRKARDGLLAFQSKGVGVKQDGKDLWPLEAGGLKLGEKVRIGSTAWSSYVGKQGAILAFDTGDDGKGLYAVLDIASAHKLHPVSGLVKLAAKAEKKAKGTPKGRAK